MKINKKAKVAALIAIPVLIGGYLIYKQLRKPKPSPIKTGGTTGGGTTGGGTTGGGTTTPTCKNYKVNTVTSNLNVRSTPELKSDCSNCIDSLPKGSVVSAKPSSTSGWMELCGRSGFVSSTYLIPA